MSQTQFSLRTLLAAVAAVGIGAALWTAEPSWQVGAIEFFLVPLVVASAATISVHSTGHSKAFWMGFAVECLWPLLVYLPVALIFSLPINTLTDDNAMGPPYLDFLGRFPMILFVMAVDFRPVLLAWAFAPVVGLLCVLTHWIFIRSAGPAEPRD